MINDVDRRQLHSVVDELPPSELAAALRYLRFLCNEASEDEPVDARTAAELDGARSEPGAAITLEEARRRLGL